jgi:hypothetical protein
MADGEPIQHSRKRANAARLESRPPDGPFVISPELEIRIVSMRPHPEEVFAAETDILGTYERMRSPGTITLDWANIGSMFWHTMLDMQQQQFYIEGRDVEAMATTAVVKTHRHETFHHFSDVVRHLFGGTYDHHAEEALAVACSYHDLTALRGEWRSKPARLSGLLFRELMQRLYRYTAPGYQGWVRYQTAEDFDQGLIDYLGPPSTPFLQKSGVDVANLLGAIRKSLGTEGVIERLEP